MYKDDVLSENYLLRVLYNVFLLYEYLFCKCVIVIYMIYDITYNR